MKMTRLFIAGDSTVANNTQATYPQAGWGQMIAEQLGHTVEVHNYALNGRSTKSFIDEGHLKNIESNISSGDFLIIQFGHNDEKKEDPTRYTTPLESYTENLKKYIHVAKSANATPILVTPVSRRLFNHQGQVINTHKDYSQAMIEVARQTQTHLINLSKKSQDLLERLGVENSKQLFMIFDPGKHPNYPNGSNDNTHFNFDGAKVISSLVIEGLLHLDLPSNLIIPF
ncbi:MAG TPA: rhamnogalacturonan acetylesterase [Epulopiscium sp.]|nr:rhamnogalacturonan acetylesterase [Candidatus Epulonipiscium sp.]